MKSKLLTTSILTFALVAAAAGAPAMAQSTNTPGIDNAQQAISARIQQGLQSGHITPAEAQMLYRRDRDIENREARFKSDGRATPQERQQLRADIADLGQDVERMIANRDVVGRGGQGNATPGIDNTKFEISRRIDEGLRSGRISQRESDRLYRRMRAIERQEAAFKSDGVVTQQERRQLRNELGAIRNQVERLINPRG